MTHIFRPKSPGKGNDYLGLQGARITGFEERSERFDWADIYLVAVLDLERCQYPLELRLMGSFEFTPGGDILIENSLVRQLYYLFDALGWKGGIMDDGLFCTEDGALIDDIAHFLNERYVPDLRQQVSMEESLQYPYMVYVYKQWNPKQQKAYMQVARKIVKNTPTGESDLERYITYLKRNGYLKEYQETTNGQPAKNGDLTHLRL